MRKWWKFLRLPWWWNWFNVGLQAVLAVLNGIRGQWWGVGSSILFASLFLGLEYLQRTRKVGVHGHRGAQRNYLHRGSTGTGGDTGPEILAALRGTTVTPTTFHAATLRGAYAAAVTRPFTGEGRRASSGWKERPLVPDSTIPIRGFREWDLSPSGELDSLVSDATWVPGMNYAQCSVKGHVPGSSYRCPCGLYAGNETYFVLEPYADILAVIPHRVSGVVELSGAVSIHRKGYRAEKGRIVYLQSSASKRTRKRLSEKYGCPVDPPNATRMFEVLRNEE